MLPRKSFSPESVLRLVLGLMVTYSGVMLLAGFFSPRLKAMSRPSEMMLSLVVETFAFYGSIVVGIALTLRADRLGWTEVFGFREPPVTRAAGVGLFAGIVATPAVLAVQIMMGIILTWLNHEPVAQEVVKNLESANTLSLHLCFGIVTILVAPVVEEMLFRGVFYPSLKRVFPVAMRFAVLQFIVPKAHGWRRRRLAAWFLRATQAARGRRNARKVSMVVISLLFACAHANLVAAVPLFLFALLLTTLYERTGNLLTPILTHSFFNAANFFLIVFEEPLKGLLPK